MKLGGYSWTSFRTFPYIYKIGTMFRHLPRQNGCVPFGGFITWPTLLGFLPLQFCLQRWGPEPGKLENDGNHKLGPSSDVQGWRQGYLGDNISTTMVTCLLVTLYHGTANWILFGSKPSNGLSRILGNMIWRIFIICPRWLWLTKDQLIALCILNWRCREDTISVMMVVIRQQWW